LILCSKSSISEKWKADISHTWFATHCTCQGCYKIWLSLECQFGSSCPLWMVVMLD